MGHGLPFSLIKSPVMALHGELTATIQALELCDSWPVCYIQVFSNHSHGIMVIIGLMANFWLVFLKKHDHIEDLDEVRE
jgi:hypothetical protein